MKKAEIGLIGLAVMGANLARNMANKNIKTVVYNRTTEKMEQFIKQYGTEFLFGRKELKDFVQSIETPRKIIILVKAGNPVDLVIEQLTPLLEKGDIVIDCGNSNYRDTQGRVLELEMDELNFMGCGVSGGEEGALNGPSLMPGGTKESYSELDVIFTKIAAKDFSAEPCVSYIGENGAGHYVKMVHNGIEYGIMQIMAEAYDILKRVYNLDAPAIAKIFKQYNQGKLSSYLFEIAVEILEKQDNQGDGHLIDKILDKAAQKGTGQWTASDSLERGVAIPTITESVYARVISSEKEKRTELSKLYEEYKKEENTEPQIPIDQFKVILEEALYAAMLSTYAQGYALIQKAAKEESWKIDLAEVSRIWQGGCIIRADVLNTLHKAFKESPQSHLFEIPKIIDELSSRIPSLRKVTSMTMASGIPAPSLVTALSYFEGMTCETSPANFIQGLRDNFGAHTFKRIDKEGDFHVEW